MLVKEITGSLHRNGNSFLIQHFCLSGLTFDVIQFKKLCNYSKWWTRIQMHDTVNSQGIGYVKVKFTGVMFGTVDIYR